MGQAVLSDPVTRNRDGVHDIVRLRALPNLLLSTVAKQPPVAKGNRVNIPDPAHGDWCALVLWAGVYLAR